MLGFEGDGDHLADSLLSKVGGFMESYNSEVDRFVRLGKPQEIDGAEI